MKHFYAIIFLFILAALTFSVKALPVDTYTEKSALAEGRWVKISVDADGIYRIPLSRLRSWGFTDPAKVVIRGYGGRRQNTVLNASSYTDDLPIVQSVVTDAGIVFYGLGAGEWLQSRQSGRYYYRQNDYSAYGHYFVGELAEGESIPEISPTAEPLGSDTGTTTFNEYVQHENEAVLIKNEAGPLLVGEDFRYTSKHRLTLQTPDAVGGSTAWFQSSFVSNTKDSNARLNFAVQGQTIPNNATHKISTTVGDHVYGAVNEGRSDFTFPENAPMELNVDVTLQVNNTPELANLNYLAVNYERYLRMPMSGRLEFTTSQFDITFDARGKETVIWDVTKPSDIKSVDYGALSADGKASWKNPTAVRRTFVAWQPSAAIPEPKTVGSVGNQNLHALSGYDMVIVSPQQYLSEAQRLAQFHESEPDSMKVLVVTPEQVYNEFSSGTLDPGGIRRFFKMLYDRGEVDGHSLRYAILMARTTLDNKGLSPMAPSYPTIPSWTPTAENASVSDNTGYSTDDFTAMLADNSGSTPGSDKLTIALGRIPVTSTSEARDVVDKILQYAKGANKTAWKHRFLFLADDGNQAVHLNDSEDMINRFSGKNPILVNKVYMDSYELIGSEYPEARKEMFRYLEEGVVWWNFIGHASPTGWTHEHQLSYTDLNNMYLRHWPFIYAATCDFLRLDASTVSGGEILFKERYGGAVGMISAVRPVYISKNSYLSQAIGRALAQRDENGLMLTPGEIYRRAKNDLKRVSNAGRPNETYAPISDDNRLRYVFVGDPALRLAMPSNIVRVDSINGLAIADDAQPTLQALGTGNITGTVTTPMGQQIADFNGVVLVDIFDAEYSVHAPGNGTDGAEADFESHGQRVYTGSTVVKDGRFSINVAMPQELSQNFRPATMSLYAYSTDSDIDAVGLCNDFYVYGFDDTAAADTIAPTIESLVLNHEDFNSGDIVNTTPMLIAQVSDNVGINVSTAGIGHQMVAILDGKQTFTGISNYYTPASDGSPSGVINYPIDDLQPGMHSLTFRVWDTAGNSAQQTIDFGVSEGLAPKIYDVYSDANPASTSANFYLRHNQPDNMVTVTITVYSLMGRPVWSRTVSGRSDMFLTMPVTWDLTDTAGRRVGRGIYLYRASITSDGQNFETASRRIAVTAR